MENVIDCQKFSKFNCLVCVTAHVLCFVEIVKGNTLHVLNLMRGHGQLEARELDRAETMWIPSILLQSFKRVLKYLENCNSSKLPNSDQFCLFLDEQHVRVEFVILLSPAQQRILFYCLPNTGL